MLHLGILKTFNTETHKAGVQLVGSLTTYLDDIAVATNIAPEAMIVGNYVLLAIPEGNPRDACVVASWPAGSSGGGGSKIQDADGDTYLWVEKTADEDKIHGVVKGVEAFLLDDKGILTLAKQSGARAHYVGDKYQIADRTAVKVPLNTEDFDLQDEYDPVTNYRFTAKKFGTYLILSSIRYYPGEDGMHAQNRICLNGNTAWSIFSLYQSGTLGITVLNAAIAIMDPADYLELWTWNDSTQASQQFDNASGSIWMAVAKIA